MKLWTWFISGSIAGLLGASLLSSVEAIEPSVAAPAVQELPAIIRILRGSHSDLGYFQLRENRDGKWDLFQDINRCEITDTEEGPESQCTQIAPAHYVFQSAVLTQTESGRRTLLKNDGPRSGFTVTFVEDLRPQVPRTTLELSGVLPGTYRLFEGVVSIELK